MSEQLVGLVIIGGGITGVAVGRLLQLSGFKDFVILEAENEAGGLCRSREIGGHVLDIGGGHMLASRYPDVYDFIFAHLPESEFNRFDRVSKIALGGAVIDYPVEYNLWQLPLDRRVDYLVSCIRAGASAGDRPPANFEAWVRQRLGDRIADDYMIPYNRKIWGVEPNELATDWLEKIPAFDLTRLVRACLEAQADAAAIPSHQRFYYPKRGGFQTLFDAILAPVAGKVRLATPLTHLRRDGADWIVNRRYRSPALVNTIPWRVLHPLVDGAPPVDAHLPALRTSGLVVTLHEEPYAHDWHWCYRPDPALRYHREFFLRNFIPHSAPNGIFRETNAVNFESAQGALAIHASEHAYPIPVKGHAEAAAAVWSAYAEAGLIGVGRWGQHRYYNSDVCIREAMVMTRAFLSGGTRAAAGAMTAKASSRLT